MRVREMNSFEPVAPFDVFDEQGEKTEEQREKKKIEQMQMQWPKISAAEFFFRILSVGLR